MNQGLAFLNNRARRLVKDSELAQDLAQDAAMYAFKGLKRFKPRGEDAFRGYLYQILVNRIRSYFRWLKRHPTVWLDERRHAAGRPAENEAIDHLGFEATLREVDAALANLPVRHRLLAAMIIDGWDHAEVSSHLDMTKAEVSRIWYRIKQKLAACSPHFRI